MCICLCAYRRRTVRVPEKEAARVDDRNIAVEKFVGTLDGHFRKRAQQLRRLLHHT